MCVILQPNVAKTALLSCEGSAIKKCMGFHDLRRCIGIEGFMLENDVCWDPKSGCCLLG